MPWNIPKENDSLPGPISPQVFWHCSFQVLSSCTEAEIYWRRANWSGDRKLFRGGGICIVFCTISHRLRDLRVRTGRCCPIVFCGALVVLKVVFGPEYEGPR